MWLTKSFATQFPVSSKVCSLYFGYGRAKGSDVLADILRELAILCPSGELAPNVAPTRTGALQHAAPSPRLLLSPSYFPSRTKIKQNLVTVSPLGWGAWAPELQLVLVLPQEGGWHRPMVRSCRKRVKRRAPALICSFPPLSLSTFWIVPLLLFPCSTSCDCGRVLSKVKDNRPLMHPSSRWLDTLPLPRDLCSHLSACCCSLPVIYNALGGFPST